MKSYPPSHPLHNLAGRMAQYYEKYLPQRCIEWKAEGNFYQRILARAETISAAVEQAVSAYPEARQDGMTWESVWEEYREDAFPIPEGEIEEDEVSDEEKLAFFGGYDLIAALGGELLPRRKLARFGSY